MIIAKSVTRRDLTVLFYISNIPEFSGHAKCEQTPFSVSGYMTVRELQNGAYGKSVFVYCSKKFQRQTISQ